MATRGNGPLVICRGLACPRILADETDGLMATTVSLIAARCAPAFAKAEQAIGEAELTIVRTEHARAWVGALKHSTCNRGRK
jgi:hypothetical protein